MLRISLLLEHPDIFPLWKVEKLEFGFNRPTGTRPTIAIAYEHGSNRVVLQHEMFHCLKHVYIRQLHLFFSDRDDTLNYLKRIFETIGRRLRVGRFYDGDMVRENFLGLLNGQDPFWNTLLNEFVQADSLKLVLFDAQEESIQLLNRRMIQEPEFFLANYSPVFPKKVDILVVQPYSRRNVDFWAIHRNENLINFIQKTTNQYYEIKLEYEILEEIPEDFQLHFYQVIFLQMA